MSGDVSSPTSAVGEIVNKTLSSKSTFKVLSIPTNGGAPVERTMTMPELPSMELINAIAKLLSQSYVWDTDHNNYPNAGYTYSQASAGCSSGYRLPTRTELQLAFGANISGFGGDYYWTSEANGADKHYTVYRSTLSSSSSSFNTDTDNYYRCVKTN